MKINEMELQMLYKDMTDGQREIFEMGVLAERERILNITRTMTKDAVAEQTDTSKLLFLCEIGSRILQGSKFKNWE